MIVRGFYVLPTRRNTTRKSYRDLLMKRALMVRNFNSILSHGIPEESSFYQACVYQYEVFDHLLEIAKAEYSRNGQRHMRKVWDQFKMAVQMTNTFLELAE